MLTLYVSLRRCLPVNIEIEIAITGPWIGEANPFSLPQCHQFVLIAQQFSLPKEFTKPLNKPR